MSPSEAARRRPLARRIRDVLAAKGASFLADLVAQLALPPGDQWVF